MGGSAEELGIDSTADDDGSLVMGITSGTERYVFLLNKARTFLRQTSGPEKPVVVANIGADVIRVDTFLGKYSVPAGTVLRLNESAPQREKKKVLLTFADIGRLRTGSLLESATLLDGGLWRPLITYADGGHIQIRDGSFVVQTLSYSEFGYKSTVTLKDPPVDPDYEIYFRCPTDWGPEVRFAGIGMKDEGLTRKHHSFIPKRGVIYEFQKLCNISAPAMTEQCTAQLPELDGADSLLKCDVP